MFKTDNVDWTKNGKKEFSQYGIDLVNESVLTVGEFHVLNEWEETRKDESFFKNNFNVDKTIQSLINKGYLCKTIGVEAIKN